MSKIKIRHSTKSDVKDLLVLMKKLASFEDYIDDFSVTEDDLLVHGFSDPTTYIAIVAEDMTNQTCQLVGYLVYYTIPFTYDLKPTLFIKELYVNKESRGNNIGKQLMSFAIKEAKDKGCGRMKWDVLSDNIKAQSFYKSFGADYDARWQGFVLTL